ncbi:NAD(P)H-dependent FMN reductase [Erwinia sp. OLTSP20]|uniref:NADPH-dependent FMN reductase n=1 Tax=unclassified Erwinia TaxID=2622719 RepID=UPI000C18AB08|nr:MULTISPECIES: NADPH-dependent FMN reductase [unclassified Erwinia]PIJ51342.1 NAD(P)H-dependent FMN reductase [Erwinia sp. OAMSP11]PIJ74126.1 NAD(P)H-dependent FMN reductase [Erwinia sp. OLSSP12]PIJ81584.1 NAD(P)H-dependent FMN reductase [Erwinia sp. OLCASP19]PIJ86089.1 NAD(P)H-dependent FMN reductase [Erwinia sp. OLMTSP26]PIJ87838.1 NAD(P)H-dependent FMN reductase [Erwinia sp. OLMDSP33]
MCVITLAGSPRYPSRSSSLLVLAQHYLTARGVEVIPWNLHNFDPADLLHARFDAPALLALCEDLQKASGLIVATPIYKASFSGALKTLLDLLPERALENKVVLPLATGGSAGHMLAVDYALKPVLNALKAREILQGVFAQEQEISYQQNQPQLTPALTLRFQQALATFVSAISRQRSTEVSA